MIGEVLEHVAKPPDTLQKLNHLLSSNGKVFLTTCCNCPADDHLYHFKSINEIREMLQNVFSIEEELSCPADPISVEEAENRMLTINYGALLKKR